MPLSIVHRLSHCLLFTVISGSIALSQQQQESLAEAAQRIRTLKSQGQESVARGEGAVGDEPQSPPVSRMTLLTWAAGGLAPADAARELRSRGVDFAVDEKFRALLKTAGAEAMLESVQAATLHATRAEEPSPDRLLKMAEAGAATHLHNYDAALKVIAEEIRQDPKNADLLFAGGNLLLEQENFAAAAMVLERSAATKPRFPYVHGRLSYAYYRMEDGIRALGEAHLMANLVPDSADAHKYIGLAMQAQGAYEAALEEYEKALGIDPEDWTVHYDVGIARAALQDFEGAVDSYLHAARIGGAKPFVFNNLGVALGRVGRVDEAVAAFERGKRLDPQALDLRQSYGALLCNSGRYEATVTEFSELLKIDPEWNMARPCLAKALTQLGRTEEAEKVKADYVRYGGEGRSE
jgi:tetratricopeptide (TPR) repeat protein